LTQPLLLIFDVNETLLDLDTLTPEFSRLFGDERVVREWFGQVILYSQALTLCNEYANFGEIGGAVLHMLGQIKNVVITPQDADSLRHAISSMPAHTDVHASLKQLKDAGFKMVTLTNNPSATALAQLSRAGIAGYFDRQFSIDDVVRRYKPARECYQWVADETKTDAGRCCLIACHTWDTLGAAAAGMSSILVTRAGNAPLPIGRQATFVADNLISAARWILREGKSPAL
jgi:2-haloacid dehalogenase